MKRGILLIMILLFGLKLCLAQSFSIRGKVIDTVTRLAAHGIVLHLVGSDGSDIEHKADTNGNYFFDSSCVRPNTYYILTAYGDKYIPASEAKIDISTKGISSREFNYDFYFQFIKNPCCVDRFFPSIQFDSGKSILSDNMKDSLNYAVRIMVNSPEVVWEIDGHASQNEGSNSKKLLLSLARAKSCKDFLVSQGIDSARIGAKGWGDAKPLLGFDKSNIRKMKTKAERDSANTLNRRVEFRMLRLDYKSKDTK